MLLWPSSFCKLAKSSVLSKKILANVCLALWKDICLLIPAPSAMLLSIRLVTGSAKHSNTLPCNRCFATSFKMRLMGLVMGMVTISLLVRLVLTGLRIIKSPFTWSISKPFTSLNRMPVKEAKRKYCRTI